ncbi:sensor histidine kinase [Acidobacteriota bacterium]
MDKPNPKIVPIFDFDISDMYIQGVKPAAHQNFLSRAINSRLFHHILFWMFFFAILSVPPEAREVPFIKLLLHNLGHIAVLIPPVYAHFTILDKFFLNRRYGIYFGLLIAIIAISGFVANSIFTGYFAYEGGLLGSYYFISFTLFIAAAAKLIKKAIKQRLQLQEIESKQLQTELDLLKVQINPHFLFNTLNNLFGMARNQDAATAEGISRLSHLMRYMIHDSKGDRIDLDKEADQIRRLIELQKLRFSDKDEIDINFKVLGETKKVQIPPMLLIPFVENAFKHGISLETPSFVHMVLKVQDKHLEFSVKNSKHAPHSEDRESDEGLGLSNVQRRLDLLFPESHELKILDAKEVYDVHLLIEL